MSILDINKPSPSQDNRNQSSKMSVDLSQAMDIECSQCNNKFFHEVVFFKKISALLSPTGQEGIIPIPTYACLECGNINKEFLPYNM